MKIEILNAIDEEFEMFPEAFGGPLNMEEVNQAEAELNVKLPKDFKEFLLRYGSGALGEAIVLGLKEAELVVTSSFVDESLHFRKVLPKRYENFTAISIDGAGNPVGFNFPDSKIITFDFNFGGKKI